MSSTGLDLPDKSSGMTDDSYSVSLANCSNITDARLTIKKGAINVIYGMNGTGKSTIAQSISLATGEASNWEELIPYGSDVKPQITGLETKSSVLVFDSEYVQNNLFVDAKNIFKDGLKVFIRTEAYRETERKTTELLESTHALFATLPELDDLISATQQFMDAFGRGSKKSGYASNSTLGKGCVSKGNLIKNIPSPLSAFAPFISNTRINAKWITWHQNGTAYADGGVCPYCGHNMTQEEADATKQLDTLYGSNYISKTVETMNAIQPLYPFLAESAKTTLTNILEDAVGADEQEQSALVAMKVRAQGLNEKLMRIKNTSFFSLEENETNDLTDKIEKAKIDKDLLGDFQSDRVVKDADKINDVLDELKTNVNELKAAVGQQGSALRKSIKDAKDDINALFRNAGYPYELEIDSSDETSCSVTLKPLGPVGSVDNVERHLSYGEKNALAIALFACQVKVEKPDIVILDDPISSFDLNKEYAILYFLFKSPGKLKGLTTLFLTHDFDVVNYLKRIYADEFPNTEASFITNRDGAIQKKGIERLDIKPFYQRYRELIQEHSGICQLIYARKLEEATNGSSLAWSMLSSLLHRKPVPDIKEDIKDEYRVMTIQEIQSATKEINSLGIDDFDYDKELSLINNDKFMVETYKKSKNPYEKIAILRILTDCPDDGDNGAGKDRVRPFLAAEDRVGFDKPMRVYLNGFFHIEDEHLFQLDPTQYNTFPSFIVDACDKVIEEYQCKIDVEPPDLISC